MNSKLYKSGLCGEMAVALHELTGLPLGVISGAFTVTQDMVNKPGSMYFDDEVGTTQYENCHAVVLVGKDKWLDVDGEHQGIPDDCVFTTPGIEGVVIRKLGKEDIEAAFSMSGFDEQDIEEAKEFVQEQPWFKASKWASKLTASTRKQVAEALLKAAKALTAAKAPVLYHGTTAEALPRILSGGLSVTQGWGGAGTEGVYLSNSPTGALMWAMSSLLSKEGEGGDPSRFFRKHKLEELALLEVRIPEDELANLKADMEQAEDYQFDGEEDDWQAALEQIGDVRFDKKIPASWLKVVPPQELEAAATKLGYDRPVSASAALEDMYYKNEDGRAHITIGDAASFADAEGAAADLQYESGLVAYLHDIESAKPGGGTRLMQHLLADLKRRGVETVALQPIGYARKGGTFEFTEYGDPGHDRLVRFYERFGFKIKPDEHPYNNPVMYLSMSRPVSASADRHSKAQEQKHWLLNKGCIAWAKAYKDIFGGKLFDVVEPEPNNTWALYPGMPHHVVVKTKDGVFHDATGPYANEQELLSFWEERRARAGDSGEKLVLEPHNGKRAKDQGLVARKSDYDLAYSILSRKP